MKLGKLADQLRALTEAEEAVIEARQAIEYGGDEATVKRKRENLQHAEWLVNSLRDEEVE